MTTLDPRLSDSGSRVGKFKDPFSGLSHAVGAVLALAGTIVLATASRDTRGATAVAVVYGISLVALFSASATYHLVRGSESLDKLLRRFDHCAIFLLIAGTYTPTTWFALQGASRVWMLATVWGFAVCGIAMRVFWLGAPRWLYTGVYLAMGWMGMLQAGAFYRGLSTPVLALLAAGGLTYTFGAVIYGLKRPNPWPGRFGFHEIWHLFVLTAAILHFVAMYVLTRG